MKYCRKMKRRQRARLGSMGRKRDTRCGCVVMSVRGEAASGMRKGGDDASWASADLTGLKNEENSCG
jgi:hypothetical protein